MAEVVRLHSDRPRTADQRSCANCLHMKDGGFPRCPQMWYCAKTMESCRMSVDLDGLLMCGPALTLWVEKPPRLWQRLCRTFL